MSSDLDITPDEESFGFFSHYKQCTEENKSNAGGFGPLLKREDLVRIESEEPSWKRARLALLIFFWVLWFGLLGAAILIIVSTPKCPPRPKLEFWQSKVGYWVDPFAFKDSGNDMIGDLPGLANGINYIKNTVGAGFVILGSFLSGYYTNGANELGLTDSFVKVDAALGTMSDFRSMVKAYHKSGLEVVVTLDINTISFNHSMFNDTDIFVPTFGFKFARDGSDAEIFYKDNIYYSIGSKRTINLNLKFPKVINQLKDVVKFWLDEGVDGFLLSDAAFFAALESGMPDETFAKNWSSNNWYSTYPRGQLFVDGCVDIVHVIRGIIDEVSKSTYRKRLLAVEMGNLGFGLRDTQDDALQFLGSQDKPAAHLVISKQFTKDRGWKTDPKIASWSKISINSYEAVSGELKSSLGLVTSTPTDQRHDDILALASTLLLPGTPIIYYGSELGIAYKSNLHVPDKLYPKGKLPFPTLSERDSFLTCHLPMPWDRSGQGFSAEIEHGDFPKYLKSYGIHETVESASSFGREPNVLQLVKRLIKLRQEPSLLWGEFEQLTPRFEMKNAEIFVRKAEQFPAFIIALLSPSPDDGSVFDFSMVCYQIIVRIVHPPKTFFPEMSRIQSNAVFLRSENQSSIYVFQCV